MKKTGLVLVIALIVLCLVSCAGPKGETGEPGPTGPVGPVQPGVYYIRIFQQGVYSSSYTGQVQASLRSNNSHAYYTDQNNPVEIGRQVVTSYYRALFRFDLSSLPSSKIIVDKAELTLWTNGVTEGGGAVNVGVYRELYPWVVNEAGFEVSSSLISWPLTALGGWDYNSNTVTVSAASFDMPADSKITILIDPALVQDWMLNPTTNYGLVLKSEDETTPNYSQIYSSGATDPTKRPMLKIWYYTTE